MSGRLWLLVAGLAATTFVMRGIGPAVFGGRRLPDWFGTVVVLLAPAVLTALVVTQAFADGERLAVGADTVGVAAAAVVFWRRGSVLVGVLVAMAVTAGLRAMT
ncbi:MAG: AzlD domain-containing protein [Sporichthyaceae bacterium]